MIERRMNVDVTASGAKSTILTVKYVLTNKVVAHDMSKSGIVERAEKAGFKTLVLTDGYDTAFTWKLEPTEP